MYSAIQKAESFHTVDDINLHYPQDPKLQALRYIPYIMGNAGFISSTVPQGAKYVYAETFTQSKFVTPSPKNITTFYYVGPM